MAILTITAADRRSLRGLAHHLDPVVMIGQHGASAAVLHEIDNALSSHELIKVRVLGDDRDERAAMLTKICETLSAAPVQHLGKLFVLFRPGKQSALGEEDAPAKKKKEMERPRHTDFPKAPPRASAARKSTDTRPPARGERDEGAASATQAPSRRRRNDDDAWSDLSPRVRQRIDPNYNAASEAFDNERRPRARPAGAGAAGKTFGKPFGKPVAKPGSKPYTPRSFGATSSAPRGTGAKTGGPFGAAPAAPRRRLRTPEGAAPETSSTDAPVGRKPADEKRFRWSERENRAPVERAPRPTTHTEPKQSKRGVARDPKAVARQSRRRLRDD